jgi:hypothetical protein
MGSVSLFAQDRLTVDLKTLPLTRNAAAFTRNYDNLVIEFPAWPATVNFANFNRVIVKVKYFDGNNKELEQKDGQGMASLFIDPKGDIFTDGSPNLLLKVTNVGGYSSSISRDNGMAVRFTKAPGGLLLQNSNADVKFIEVTEITFFRR